MATNNNRRKFEEIDTEWNPHERNFKRFRNDRDFSQKQPDKIEDLIIKLGDTGSRVEQNLIKLLDALDGELENNKESTIESICKCCISFPSKVTVYATLIGLINEKNYKACGEIIEILCRSYTSYLEAQKWKEALTIVHIFSNLVNCRTIRNTSLLALFETLLEVTLEDNSTQTRSDYYVYTVLSSLMYVGQELSESKSQDLEQIMNTISNFISKRQKLHLNALSVWLSNDPMAQTEYMDSLWTQISNLKAMNWSENVVDRPYNIPTFQEKLAANLAHNLEPIQVPAHSSLTFYPYPRVVFRLFDEDAMEEEKPMPKSDSIERFYLENQFRFMIEELGKQSSKFILNIHRRDEIPIEFVLAELLIGDLLALPVSENPDILYSSLMLDLCRFSPKKFTAALAQAIQILYENLETMNVTCVNRFVDWFAFHLNNYSFLWSWQQWQDCLSEDDLHPKPVFARELISRCIRLSFYDKTVALLADTLAPLMPNEPAVRDKYMSDEEIQGHQLSLELKQMIIKKVELPSYNPVLNIALGESGDKVVNDEKPAEHLMNIDVFTNVLLNIASKSFTHLFSAIGKFQSIFKALMRTDDSKMQLLKSIHYTWKTHPQLQVVLVDKLLKINLIDVCVVCDWIFTAEMSLEAMKFYPWEILNNTVSRQCKRKDVLIKKLEEAKNDTESLEMNNITNLEEQLESTNMIEEKMFCIIFERFTKILSEHIHKCKSTGKDFKDHWFRWMIGHMQQVFFQHNRHIFCHAEAIESLTFTSDMLDTHILLIFKQFLSLRA